MEYYNKLKAMAMGQEEEEESLTLLGNLDAAVTLTYKQRLIGFGCSFGLGMVLCLLSVPMIWTAHISRFAIFYSLGSILSLCSTMFLMGPLSQLKKMMESHRVIATSVYLASIVATLFVGLEMQNPPLALICLLIQLAALIWYCFTWIPGGVTFLKAMITRAAG